MGSDVILVIKWWLVWLASGLVAWPIVRRIFSNWDDQGYGLAKIFGAGMITWIVWVLGTLKILPFTQSTILIVTFGVGIISLVINRYNKDKKPIKLILVEEIMFLVALLGWAYVKGHEPTINGLEKFMDFGFTKSILSGDYFPPKDMWFAGGSINYYYFGHLMLAVATKISGVDLAVTFNLMLCTLFSLTFTMTWSLMRKLLAGIPERWKLVGATLTALLMVFAGNLQTIYAFTKGYANDTPPAFWTIWSNLNNQEEVKAGWERYWYPNATRFIPWTIHEFPAYSFVVSDIHGHVLDIPIALLCIGLLMNLYLGESKSKWWEHLIYGMVAGWAFSTSALDGLVYFGLWFWILIVQKKQNIKRAAMYAILMVMMFAITVSPLMMYFKSFVSGLGVNCPPITMANKKIGPLLFETADKCQKSPLWMWLVLWGFFWYCAIVLTVQIEDENEKAKALLLAFSIFSLGLTIFPEFFYFKDIYPQHFRSNTMFKFGYQAYMMMMLVSGYTITKLLRSKWNWQKLVFIFGLLPLLFLISIYPLFSLKSYFGNLGLKNYKGLYGLTWLIEKYPDDYKAMEWLKTQIQWPNQNVVLEANGDSYTDANRFSAFTGYPTIAGWLVHEWLWRSYEQISTRNEEVKNIYEAKDLTDTKKILSKYGVKYLIVSQMERQKYPELSETNILKFAQVAFESGETKVYQVF